MRGGKLTAAAGRRGVITGKKGGANFREVERKKKGGVKKDIYSRGTFSVRAGLSIKAKEEFTTTGWAETKKGASPKNRQLHHRRRPEIISVSAAITVPLIRRSKHRGHEEERRRSRGL